MRHVERAPAGARVPCPMCEGKGFLIGRGCNYLEIAFECMLCDGKRIIDAGIARDYIIERLERLARLGCYR